MPFRFPTRPSHAGAYGMSFVDNSPSWSGQVLDVENGCRLMLAALFSLIPRFNGVPSLQRIQSSAVYVWDQADTGYDRWHDDIYWDSVQGFPGYTLSSVLQNRGEFVKFEMDCIYVPTGARMHLCAFIYLDEAPLTQSVMDDPTLAEVAAVPTPSQYFQV